MSFLEKIYNRSSELTMQELNLIAEKHQRIRIPKGEFLLKESQHANEYYCIEQGLIRTYVIDFNGNDITTNFIGQEGIAIDVLSLFHRLPAKENMQTLSEVYAWKIEFNHFQELYHKIEGYNEWGRAWMAQQLFDFKQKSLEMITLSAKERYLQILEKFPQVVQQAPLKYIATFLGITDTSLSRIRKEIAKEKLSFPIPTQ